MTREHDFKRLVRARMRSTGERYTAARAALLRNGKEERMIPVTCEMWLHTLTEQEMEQFPGVKPPSAEELGDLEPFYPVAREKGQQPMLLLREIGGARWLAIFCGPVEATAVAFALKGIETPRPMTHDLLRDVVAALGEAREVRVTELRDQTFFAELIVIDKGGAEQAVSCRPSDGIAFALRAEIPILVEESLFDWERPLAKGDK